MRIPQSLSLINISVKLLCYLIQGQIIKSFPLLINPNPPLENKIMADPSKAG